MLPVLKEAGVVDSGGQGLLEVIKGAYDAFLGKEIDYSVIEPSTGVTVNKVNAEDTADIKFGYCTEFIILTEKEFTEEDEHEFKKFLSSIGDSIVCVADDDIIKIHVHTDHPGLAIEKALTIGSLSGLKIDNMREQHTNKINFSAEAPKAEAPKAEQPKKDVGFVSISAGEGLTKIFKNLGVDEVIEGGQTMNPSTEDILNAVDKINAEHIFILPNNKNIILAAEQARSMVEDKKIYVVPSKTVPQGIAALINFLPDATPDENLQSMTEEMQNVHTGQITYAVRNTSIDGMEIKEGDIMGIGDYGMLAVGKELEDVSLESLKKMVTEESELISIYYGEDVSEEDAQKLLTRVQEEFPDCEAELNNGGQPIYYYLLSVE